MSNKETSVISSLDYRFSPRQALVGAQMLFVAFGALVLVPLLTGLDPNVALFTAGLGTLIFQIVTRGRVPIFLASSFAFIAPIKAGVAQWGVGETLCGIVASGVAYYVVSLLVRWKGIASVQRILPPIVTGPIIMVIGLSLAPVAVDMALGRNGGEQVVDLSLAMPVALLSLAVTICMAVFSRGFFKLLPILSGIVAGYAFSAVLGIVDYSVITNSAWVGLPNFTFPKWSAAAAIAFIPVAIAPIIEHVGDIYAVSALTGRDYTTNPGLDKTLLGDGLATSVAGLFGGPPSTTYAEVIGGLALTRAFNPAVLTWAAITAIALSFVSKLGAVLHSIPGPVMGGIMVLLFGAIAVVGMNILVRSGRDLTVPRNMAIIAVMMVFGIGGMVFQAGDFVLEGIGLAGVVGVMLNLVLPDEV